MALLLHILQLLGAVGLSYVWLSSPALRPYSPQLFALTVIGYFLVKKLSTKHGEKTKFSAWILLPRHSSLEMSLITLSFLLMIGHTGNLKSFLFPLSFVHLFFLTLSTETLSALIATLAIVWFHFSLTPNPSMPEISLLLSLPITEIGLLIFREQLKTVLNWKRAGKVRPQVNSAQANHLSGAGQKPNQLSLSLSSLKNLDTSASAAEIVNSATQISSPSISATTTPQTSAFLTNLVFDQLPFIERMAHFPTEHNGDLIKKVREISQDAQKLLQESSQSIQLKK